MAHHTGPKGAEAAERLIAASNFRVNLSFAASVTLIRAVPETMAWRGRMAGRFGINSSQHPAF